MEQALEHYPAVALLGPRQVGKTTLAHVIEKKHPSLYLDLESPEDRLKLDDPLLFFSQHRDKLIILDEIHRMPDLFLILRGLIDKGRREGRKGAQFLILGSASGSLLKQASESLAGRISYLEMTGFNLLEMLEEAEKDKVEPKVSDALALPKTNTDRLQTLWLRGGFPESCLAENTRISFDWREDFIRTYLERDIPQIGFRVPVERMRRLWTMLAHLQGQTLNISTLAGNLDLSGKTIKYYVDILTELLLLRCLKPWHANVKKRLIKSPRVYIRDSGLMNRLLAVFDYNQLLSHPAIGAGWEGFVIENIISVLPKGTETYFYRSSAGAEIDLIVKLSSRDIWAIEIKRGLSPKVQRGFHQACEDVQAVKKYLIYSGEDKFPIKNNITVLNLPKMMKTLVSLNSALFKQHF